MSDNQAVKQFKNTESNDQIHLERENSKKRLDNEQQEFYSQNAPQEEFINQNLHYSFDSTSQEIANEGNQLADQNFTAVQTPLDNLQTSAANDEPIRSDRIFTSDQEQGSGSKDINNNINVNNHINIKPANTIQETNNNNDETVVEYSFSPNHINLKPESSNLELGRAPVEPEELLDPEVVNTSDISDVTDTDATANAVSESASNGAVVGVTAFASDADGSDTVSYSLSNDAGGAFTIDSSTGVVTVADSSLIDYESNTSMSIEVTATSTDGSTSTQTFSIGVNDDTSEFSISAITDTDATANAVSESASNGAVVGVTAFASDADGSDTVSYSLSNDAGGAFTIDSSTGVVTVADSSLIDYESNTSMSIEVTATSTDGSTSTQTFSIGVNDDASEFSISAITDTDATANAVSESASNGAVVGVTAFASDADGSDTVSYSLSNDAGGAFTIDSSTGVVTVADSSLIDYESNTSMSIEVTATSTDGSTSTQTFSIGVNDDASEFSISAITDTDATANAVSESASNGAVVGVTAFASDADGSDTVSYSLSNDAGGAFTIDSSTGVVTVADSSLIDYESNTSMSIEVTATSTDGSTSTQTFSIGVNDDTSEFSISAITDTDATTNAVSESASNGAVVGVTAFASDADGSDTVSYSLSNDAGGAFTIDSSTGVVTVADSSLIDYESNTSMSIEVTATSTDGSTSTQTFSIAVNDDTSEFGITPITDTDATTNAVSESASNGAVVGVTAFASDADGSDTVSYSLSNDAGGAFTIDSSTGVVTVADSSLIDYESNTSMSIEVTATSTDGSTSTQTFSIGVNDDTSEFSISAITDTDATANAVSESASNGAVVGVTAFASDADGSDTVSYSLSNDAGGAFTIDSSTGVVTVADSSLIDYESNTSMSIEVTATSTDGSTSTQTFSIGVNDDTSEFSISAITDTDATANAVSESASNGAVVGVTAFASDADGSDTVSYSLSNDAGGAFTIDSSTGVVTVADSSLIDYESNTSMSIEVTATSTDGSTSTQTFSIGVNDDASEFSISAITDTDATANAVSESASNGAVVGVTAFASDADGSDTVSYSLSNDAGGAFTIDSSTGVVTVADSSLIDYESNTSMSIEVTATSTDGSTSTQTFSIGVNDDASEFSISAITDTDATANAVSESASNGAVVGVTAFASDADGSDTVSYSLSNDAGGAFTIDSSTGVVTVADSSLIDYESNTSMSIEVTATSTDGSTSTQTFSIGVNDDTSEFSISAITDTDATANAVSESASNGAVVGVTAFASDADGSDTVSYSLSNDAGGAFTIDSSTGVVTVADSSLIDYESNTSMSIEVTATSTDGSTSTQTFSIGVNDDTSEFSISAITDTDATANAVSESASNGAVVGVTAFASDADGSDTVSYSLSNDAGGAFKIDSSTGVVTVADSSLIDYESNTSMSIEVTATSTDGSTSTQTFSIAVNDDTSEFSISAITDTDATTNAVSESASNGAVVGVTAFASDADGSDTVSYSLSNDAGGAFTIDSSTGVVTVADSSLIDYESNTSMSIEVTATSTDGSTSTQTFSIGVNDDTSEFSISAITDTDATANAVSESASNGAVVGVTAFASDADGSDTVSYSLSNDAGGAFTIDSSTGVVTVADSSLIDYESNTSMSIEVTATSTDGSTSTQTFSIGVNDDTSEFSISAITDTDATANAVSESASNGAVVGVTAFASDADGSDTVSYSLSNDAGGAFTIDSSTGVVTVADSSLIDYESNTSMSIEVTATSTDGSTSTQTFSIGVNDDTSEFSISAITDTDATTNAVSESASNGAVVGVTAFASDADGSDTVSYSLSNDAGGAFTIDSSTGVVTVADSSLIDYESNTSMSIEVTATSTDGSTSTQTFSIAVNDDTSEFGITPITDTDATTNAVSESASNGAVVGVTAFASDADGSDTVSYSLSNDAGGAFTIDATTGVVTVADSSLIDYESNTSMSIEVTATSTDGSTSTQTFNIAVNDINEAPTDMTFTGNNNLSSSVSDSGVIAANTVVADVATVVDVDAGDTHTFSLLDNAGGKFSIDANTGEISLVASHNTSSAYSDTVTVQVTDAGGNTYSETIGINLGTSTAETISGTNDTDITYSLDGGDTQNGGSGDDALYASDGITTVGGSGNVGTDYSLIHLGNAADVDTNETDGVSENASNLLGSYGSSGSPLYNEIVSATANDTDGDNRLDDNDSGNTAETFTIDGADHALDSVQVYNSTVTFTDGTSSAFTAVVIQLDNGEVYMAPEFSDNADVSVLESKPIESISLDTLIVDNTNLYAERHDSDYAVVDDGDTLNGGAGDDTLVSGGADDILNGGDGNDMFIFSEGDGTDTINGGAGGGWTDTIHLNDSSGGSNIGTYGTDWTLNLSEGSVQSTDANSIDLSDDADGQIVMQDGSTINFTDIERIEW